MHTNASTPPSPPSPTAQTRQGPSSLNFYTSSTTSATSNSTETAQTLAEGRTLRPENASRADLLHVAVPPAECTTFALQPSSDETLTTMPECSSPPFDVKVAAEARPQDDQQNRQALAPQKQNQQPQDQPRAGEETVFARSSSDHAACDDVVRSSHRRPTPRALSSTALRAASLRTPATAAATASCITSPSAFTPPSTNSASQSAATRRQHGTAPTTATATTILSPVVEGENDRGKVGNEISDDTQQQLLLLQQIPSTSSPRTLPGFSAIAGYSFSSHSYGISSNQSAISPKGNAHATGSSSETLNPTSTTSPVVVRARSSGTGRNPATAETSTTKNPTTPNTTLREAAAAEAWMASRSMSAHALFTPGSPTLTSQRPSFHSEGANASGHGRWQPHTRLHSHRSARLFPPHEQQQPQRHLHAAAASWPPRALPNFFTLEASCQEAHGAKEERQMDKRVRDTESTEQRTREQFLEDTPTAGDGGSQPMKQSSPPSLQPPQTCEENEVKPQPHPLRTWNAVSNADHRTRATASAITTTTIVVTTTETATLCALRNPEQERLLNQESTEQIASPSDTSVDVTSACRQGEQRSKMPRGGSGVDDDDRGTGSEGSLTLDSPEMDECAVLHGIMELSFKTFVEGGGTASKDARHAREAAEMAARLCEHSLDTATSPNPCGTGVQRKDTIGETMKRLDSEKKPRLSTALEVMPASKQSVEGATDRVPAAAAAAAGPTVSATPSNRRPRSEGLSTSLASSSHVVPCVRQRPPTEVRSAPARTENLTCTASKMQTVGVPCTTPATGAQSDKDDANTVEKSSPQPLEALALPRSVRHRPAEADREAHKSGGEATAAATALLASTAPATRGRSLLTTTPTTTINAKTSTAAAATAKPVERAVPSARSSSPPPLPSTLAAAHVQHPQPLQQQHQHALARMERSVCAPWQPQWSHAEIFPSGVPTLPPATEAALASLSPHVAEELYARALTETASAMSAGKPNE